MSAHKFVRNPLTSGIAPDAAHNMFGRATNLNRAGYDLLLEMQKLVRPGEDPEKNPPIRLVVHLNGNATDKQLRALAQDKGFLQGIDRSELKVRIALDGDHTLIVAPNSATLRPGPECEIQTRRINSTDVVATK